MSNENVIDRKKTKITLRDNKEYVLQPLTINELIDLWPIIVKLENNKEDVTVDLLKDMRTLVYRALKNQIEQDKVGDLVDLADIRVIIAAVIGQNQQTLEALSNDNQ